MFSRLRRLPLCAVAMLAACAVPGSKVPDPRQPVLESVRISGNRICGGSASANAPASLAFACPALPAREPSGWKLTPAWIPSTADPKRLQANRTVVINVSTPRNTEIDVELMRGDGQLPLPVKLVQADPAAGVPGEIAIAGQAGITAIEDGRKRLWMIEAVVSTCAQTRRLRITNRAAKDADPSPPLEVTLARDAAETICIEQPGLGPAARPGVGDPVAAREPAGCAGSGGTGKLFQVCESCPALHPAQMSVFSAGRYCTWEEALAAYGYTGEGVVRPQLCKLSQVSSRESCEGR